MRSNFHIRFQRTTPRLAASPPRAKPVHPRGERDGLVSMIPPMTRQEARLTATGTAGRAYDWLGVSILKCPPRTDCGTVQRCLSNKPGSRACTYIYIYKIYEPISLNGKIQGKTIESKRKHKEKRKKNESKNKKGRFGRLKIEDGRLRKDFVEHNFKKK